MIAKQLTLGFNGNLYAMNLNPGTLHRHRHCIIESGEVMLGVQYLRDDHHLKQHSFEMSHIYGLHPVESPHGLHLTPMKLLVGNLIFNNYGLHSAHTNSHL